MAAIEAEVMHTHCKRCKGQLTAKESMRRGYGPVCYKKAITPIDLIKSLTKLANSNKDENFMDELDDLEKRRKIG
ncbi:DUF6011 domain-containing protein [Shouchella miscanthi]|uniref:DUF6011 domain-containing protein n=1 Tax=Shouchella miscanthi TaxID=2598861 RepID=UPI0011A76172|nr:DUF6011 domain-containing protein [Shouchella miscanthi]